MNDIINWETHFLRSNLKLTMVHKLIQRSDGNARGALSKVSKINCFVKIPVKKFIFNSH